MKKRLYDLRGFSGPDVTLSISLGEYGIAWKETKPGQFTFLVGSGFQEDGESYRFFSFFHFSAAELLDMTKEEWFDAYKVKDFLGLSEEDNFDIPGDIHGFIQYHGTENIFGTDYLGGFEISGLE